MSFGATPLIGRRPADINDENPEFTPGQYFSWRDPATLELHIYRYLQNISGAAIARGDLMGKAAAIGTGEVDGTCSLRHVYDAAKFTANEHGFDFINIYKDAAAGGAAPEADFRMLAAGNTVNEVRLDPSAADFSALPVTGDLFEIERPFKCIDGSGTQVIDTYQGWAAAAISDDYWGMFLVKGRRINWLSGTATAGIGVVGNGVSIEAVGGSDAQETILGVASALTAYDSASACIVSVDILSGGATELGA